MKKLLANTPRGISDDQKEAGAMFSGSTVQSLGSHKIAFIFEECVPTSVCSD